MREGKQEKETRKKEINKVRNSRRKQFKMCHNFPEKIGQLSVSYSEVSLNLARYGVHTSSRLQPVYGGLIVEGILSLVLPSITADYLSGNSSNDYSGGN
jgi:hypothetical protein